MIILRPVTITDAILDATNVAENDDTEWSSATSYAVDDTCMDSRSGEHKLYQCLIANSNQDPSVSPTNSNGDAYWLETGPTNRWAMFDDKNSTQTSNSTSIDIDLIPGSVVNGIGFLNIDADSIQVRVNDPTAGDVYDTTFDTSNNSTVNNWYDYFFEEIIAVTELVVLDLPPYENATFHITISKATAKCGTLSIGLQKNLGETLFGTSIGITDYSIKQFDSFGNQTIVTRNYAKRAEYSVSMRTPFVGEAQRLLALYRTTPMVWIGDENYSSTIIYGFYRDFDIGLSNPIYSDCSITVEGLT